MRLISALMEEPGKETAQKFHDAIRDFRQWTDPPEPWNLRFIQTQKTGLAERPALHWRRLKAAGYSSDREASRLPSTRYARGLKTSPTWVPPTSWFRRGLRSCESCQSITPSARV